MAIAKLMTGQRRSQCPINIRSYSTLQKKAVVYSREFSRFYFSVGCCSDYFVKWFESVDYLANCHELAWPQLDSLGFSNRS
jgi:hypothetical protein